jgi:fructose-1,6-bisphosphatase II / sedoheptulose-1,7-bisphosphatase
MKSAEFERDLASDAVNVVEAAAIAAAALVGRGDEKAADQAAVDAMRTALNSLDIDGKIVIGEGERDEAPMLYIGEKVGTGRGPRVDIALDPLEGTTLTAKAMANALAVVAMSPDGGMLHAPDTYMDKIAIGPGYPEGLVDLDAEPAENALALARAKGVDVADITACVLDRPRHAEIIASLRRVGDLYIGQGGAPEGVLACAALKCVGGQFQGRLVFRNDDERSRAERLGLTDFDRKYTLHELVRTDAVFAAAGHARGAMLDGVRFDKGFVTTDTLVMSSATRTVRRIKMKRPA